MDSYRLRFVRNQTLDRFRKAGRPHPSRRDIWAADTPWGRPNVDQEQAFHGALGRKLGDPATPAQLPTNRSIVSSVLPGKRPAGLPNLGPEHQPKGIRSTSSRLVGPSMHRDRWPSGLVLCLVLSGCGDSSTTDEAEQDTVVIVSPDDFLGEVACADWPGAMRRYVATLIDVSDDLVDLGSEITDFALPSSDVVDCQYPVGFARVVVDHLYVARIEGYDRVDIEPAAPGSSLVVEKATGNLVTPKWQTSCGQTGALGADGPVTPIELGSVYVTGCDPLTAASRSPLSGVSVDLDVALGILSCVGDGGDVERFEVRAAESDEAYSVECGSSLQLVAFTPGVLVSWNVAAYTAEDDEPRWRTTCYAVAQAGTVVSASCDVLTDLGSD